MTPTDGTGGLEAVIAGLLLGLTLPLIAVIALAIKFDSRGPVFHREERTGPGGCRFTALTFRTGAHDGAHFTRVGWFLWYTRLEKLPQLINVLNGQMSCIGVDPERPYFLS